MEVLAAFMYIIVIDDITTTKYQHQQKLNILWLSTKVIEYGLLASMHNNAW